MIERERGKEMMTRDHYSGEGCSRRGGTVVYTINRELREVEKVLEPDLLPESSRKFLCFSEYRTLSTL